MVVKRSGKWLGLAMVALVAAGVFSVMLEDGSHLAAFAVVMCLGLAVWFLGEVWRAEDEEGEEVTIDERTAEIAALKFLVREWREKAYEKTAENVELEAELASLKAGYAPDHPLVRCSDCAEEYTACDLGNHYCPSCGESCEDATPVDPPPVPASASLDGSATGSEASS